MKSVVPKLFLLPKYAVGHCRIDTYSIPIPSAATRESVDKIAPPTCYPCDRNISNYFRMIQVQNFSRALIGFHRKEDK